jgi:CBS domain-containing protein
VSRQDSPTEETTSDVEVTSDDDRLIYVSRVLRLALLDDRDARLGRVVEVVAGTPNGLRAPPILGFVAVVAKRRVFVPGSHVARVSTAGVQLTETAIDMRSYAVRRGEIAIGPLVGSRLGAEQIADVGLSGSDRPVAYWSVAVFVLAQRSVRRAPLRIVTWREGQHLFSGTEVDRDVARFRDLNAHDTARAFRTMPTPRRRKLTDALSDEALADVLETLPDEDQTAITDGLEAGRLAGVIAEMESDDAVDLLVGVAPDRREELLQSLDARTADRLRRLIEHDGDTAGGLMRPDPIVLTLTTSIAEALVHLRSRTIPIALSTIVFVTERPTHTPTGQYLGAVSFRKLLRSPPSAPLSTVVSSAPQPVAPELPAAELAEPCARLDLSVVPVCDTEQRLLGAVMVSDVIGHLISHDRTDA